MSGDPHLTTDSLSWFQDPMLTRELRRVLYLECILDSKGVYYRGKINTTVSGMSCQRWDAQHPHKHRFKDASKFPDATLEDAANFCRNPNDGPSPWCYPVHPNETIARACSIPLCDVGKKIKQIVSIMT